MKEKAKVHLRSGLILLTLLMVPISICSITQAKTTYNITISQNPTKTNVHEGQSVVVTATLYPTEGDAEQVIDTWFSPTELWWYKNDVQQTKIKCNQALPTITNTITFTLGAFIEGDTLAYRVFLGLDNADDYASSTIVFNVLPRQIINIGVIDYIPLWLILVIASATTLIIVLIIVLLIKRKRSKEQKLDEDILRNRIIEASKERSNKLD